MNLILKELDEDGQYQQVGTVTAGVPDEEVLEIVPEEQWEAWDEDAALASLDGPMIVAERADLTENVESEITTDEVISEFRQRLNEGDDEFEIIRDENGQFAEVRPDNVDQFDSQTRMENAFEFASDETTARDAGIQEGNTTGEAMVILDYEDGSRDFATPVQAYDDAEDNEANANTSEEAKKANLTAPAAVDALGGNAAGTALTTDDDGTEYIVKEGFEGEMVNDVDSGDISEQALENMSETVAAGYIAGNRDLHSLNVMMNPETDEVQIIDHDSMQVHDAFDSEHVRTLKYKDHADSLIHDAVETKATEVLNGEYDISNVDEERQAIIEANAQEMSN